jgi:hypothetical protein
MPDNVRLFERVPFWRDASVRGATRCVLAEAVTEKGEHIRLWISQRGSISKRHIEPTVDGEPVFDEITKALVAYPRRTTKGVLVSAEARKRDLGGSRFRHQVALG